MNSPSLIVAATAFLAATALYAPAMAASQPRPGFAPNGLHCTGCKPGGGSFGAPNSGGKIKITPPNNGNIQAFGGRTTPPGPRVVPDHQRCRGCKPGGGGFGAPNSGGNNKINPPNGGNGQANGGKANPPNSGINRINTFVPVITYAPRVTSYTTYQPIVRTTTFARPPETNPALTYRIPNAVITPRAAVAASAVVARPFAPRPAQVAQAANTRPCTGMWSGQIVLQTTQAGLWNVPGLGVVQVDNDGSVVIDCSKFSPANLTVASNGQPTCLGQWSGVVRIATDKPGVIPLDVGAALVTADRAVVLNCAASR